MCVRKKKQKDYNMKIFYQSWLRFIYILVILIKVIVWIVMEKKEAWLDKKSGKMCLAISPKAMKITGFDDRRYWERISSDESRSLLRLSLSIHLFRFVFIFYLLIKKDINLALLVAQSKSQKIRNVSVRTDPSTKHITQQ